VTGSHLAVRPIDAARFRSVLSHYPTGVCAVTAMHDGEPTGFVVGSFTSISLEPPLVGFFPDKGSTTFPKVREAGAFCANVLSAEDEPLCRLFAAKDADRFASVTWREGATGAPILDRATAWVECEIGQVIGSATTCWSSAGWSTSPRAPAPTHCCSTGVATAAMPPPHEK
jgi:flavin reductase (DIM6/NTAB) family NADH-FMN oxidoreductase RutF